MRKLLTAGLTMALLLGAVASVSAAPKPVNVFEDAAGDADAGQGAGQSIPAGLDLAGGSIALNGKNLDFTVTHHDMPPAGSLPEFARFIWAFNVNGEDFRLIVKRLDVGKPDAINGDGTERVGQADPNGHYRVEGECIQDSSLPVALVKCKTLGYITGAFDPASMSFTANVPLELIGAKAGMVVQQGAGASAGICPICWIPHHAERSLNLTAIDTAAQSVAYKIPKK